MENEYERYYITDGKTTIRISDVENMNLRCPECGKESRFWKWKTSDEYWVISGNVKCPKCGEEFDSVKIHRIIFEMLA